MICGRSTWNVGARWSKTMQANATRPPSIGRAEIIELAFRCGPAARFELLELADWLDVVASGCGRLERVPRKWRGLVGRLASQ